MKTLRSTFLLPILAAVAALVVTGGGCAPVAYHEHVIVMVVPEPAPQPWPPPFYDPAPPPPLAPIEVVRQPAPAQPAPGSPPVARQRALNLKDDGAAPVRQEALDRTPRSR